MKVEWNKENLRSLRKHLGLYQWELAQRLGVKQQTISKWEIGKNQPRRKFRVLFILIGKWIGLSEKQV